MNTLLRFGLGTLLFLTACVGGFFGGYRAGHNHGAAAYLASQTTTEEYYVADLVTIHPRPEDVDFIAETLRETVGNWSDWSDHGGYASIEFNPDHLSLVVTHNQACHREIKAFLRTLRMGRSLDDPNALARPSSPQRMVLLDVADLLAAPGRKQPGFEEASLEKALQSAVPAAKIWGITDEGLRVYGNYAEIHQMKTTLAAIRELKYTDRFETRDGPNGVTYVLDKYSGITWMQRPNEEVWTLFHSQ
jgi:hypothetical protein